MPIVISPGATPPAPPTTVTSSDGFLTVTLDAANGGVLLEADFSGEPTQPYQVRFLRNGEPVRSGDNAWAPGGYALAYDYEMTLGVAAIWTALPYYRVAGVLVAGTPTGAAAVTVPDVDTTLDFWVKSVPNPNLSLRLRSQVPDPQISRAGRNSLGDIPGSPVAAGSWDVGLTSPRSINFMTATHADRDALLALLDSGPVLVQSLALYGIYDFYAIAGDVGETYHVGAFDPRRVITVNFIPVGRPATAGAPLYIPGHSYNDVNDAYADYVQLDAARPSYRSVVAP